MLRFSCDSEYAFLSDTDKHTVWFCERYLHGLPFYPSASEGIDLPILRQRDLLPVLSATLQTGSLPDRTHKVVVAYKGSANEKDWIESLGFEAFNLDEIDCPKTKSMIYQCSGSLHRDCSKCAVNSVMQFKNFLCDKNL